MYLLFMSIHYSLPINILILKQSFQEIHYHLYVVSLKNWNVYFILLVMSTYIMMFTIGLLSLILEHLLFKHSDLYTINICMCWDTQSICQYLHSTVFIPLLSTVSIPLLSTLFMPLPWTAPTTLP